jgi:alcohol dehydrogenase class IV
MSVSAFKIANKLITGPAAIEQLSAELTRLNVQNPLIVTDAILVKSGTVDLALAQLGGRRYGLFDQVKPEPEISIVEDCTRAYREGGHDGLIGVGGGSAIDIAKGVAAFASHEGPLAELFGVDLVKRKGPPLIAIPTTAGTGSEVTNVAIFSDKQAQLKKGIVSDYLLPDVALVSPLMTLTCPRSVTAASGVDALVHAIESYLSVNASPITDAIALGAIKLIVKALPKAYANPSNLQAREDMATASLMAGMAFGNAGVGAVHAFQHCPRRQQCAVAAVCDGVEQAGLRRTDARHCRRDGRPRRAPERQGRRRPRRESDGRLVRSGGDSVWPAQLQCARRRHSGDGRGGQQDRAPDAQQSTESDRRRHRENLPRGVLIRLASDHAGQATNLSRDDGPATSPRPASGRRAPST